MRRTRWLPVAVAGLVVASPVVAEPLTCATFKDRLSGALIAAGDPGAEMLAFQDRRATSDGGTHSNWRTSALTGSLTCGSADRFQEFYVGLDVTTRDQFAEQLKRLVSLDGAVICTVATAGTAACVDTGKIVLQQALQQMGSGFQRGIGNPSGVSDREPWPDLKAEVTAAPSLITFSFAAKEGATVDASRRPLPALPNPIISAPPLAKP